MILHLVDDEKVINRAIDFFEKALPGENLFLCFCKKGASGSYAPKHVSLDQGVLFYDSQQDEIPLSFLEIDQIVAHSIGPHHISFIDRYVPNGIPICWLIWGYDLYNQILYGAGYHLFPYNNSVQTHKEWLYNRIKRLIGYKSARSKHLIDFVRRRITSVGSCEGDYELLRKYGIVNQIPYIKYYYYPIEDVLGPLYGKSISEDADIIMCSNSASEAGNHEYIFKHLHRLGIEKKLVVVPLSYCGTEEYKVIIRKKGQELFGDQFKPIMDFLPLNQYNALFLKASICIYGSWRQMAVGNILVALYMGAKVYLSKHNPWLKDARKAGYKVFVLEQATRKSFAEPLSEQDKLLNRRLVETSCSSEELIELIKTQFK